MYVALRIHLLIYGAGRAFVMDRDRDGARDGGFLNSRTSIDVLVMGKDELKRIFLWRREGK